MHIIIVCKKTSIFFKCLNRKVQAQGFHFLKIKEFTFVNDCFQKRRNAEIGLFGQVPIRQNQFQKSTLVVLFLFLSINIFGQQSFSGKIFDAGNKEVLVGASVFVKELQEGSIADINGNYSLNLPRGKYSIVVSYLGYTNIEEQITINNKNIHRNFYLSVSPENLDEVIITGKSSVQIKREQPFQVSILDAKSFQVQSKPVTGLINSISGVRVRKEGGLGSNVNIMLNGVGGKGIRIFVDDIPADLLGSGMAINNLPVNMIDHIEVYKGVIPAKFGSDALGGIVNMVTRNTKKDYLDISAGAGSFGTYQASLNSRKYYGSNKKYYLGLSGFYNHSDNDYWMDDVKLVVDEQHNTQTGRVRRFNDAYTSYVGRLTFGIRNLSWANELQFNFLSSYTYKEWQHGLTAEAPWGETFSEQTDVNSELRWKKYGLFKGKTDASLNAGYNYIDFYFEDIAAKKYYWGSTNGIPQYIESAPGETDDGYTNGRNPRTYNNNGFVRLNLVHRLHKNHSLNFTLLYTTVHIKGHDYRGIETFGSDVLANPQTMNKNYAGLALESKLLDKRLTNILSVKNFSGNSKIVVINDALTSEGQEENTYSKFGYGDALKLQVVPALCVILNYEYTLRMPDAEELFGDFVTIWPNAELDPEESHNVDVGLRYKTSGKKISAEMNGFYRNTSNLIFQNSLRLNKSVYMNLLATETFGTEGEVRYSPAKKLDIYANITWQDIRLKKTDPEGKIHERYIGAHIPNTPWLFGNAGMNFILPWHITPKDKIQVYYTCNYVHDFYRTWEVDGIKDGKTSIPRQVVHNGGVSYVFRNEKLSMNVECRNFTDEKAYDNYMVQKPGKNIMFKLRYFLEKQ